MLAESGTPRADSNAAGAFIRRRSLAFAGAAVGLAAATGLVRAQRPASPAAGVPDLGVLRGRWVRPDGGYVIEIRAVDASGKLDASYANPRPLPFAKAEVVRDGGTIGLYLELRAGGYDGSSYALVYDPVGDRLVGVYTQAVARQKFDVRFERAK
jgi:hypothetical protein